MSDLSNLSDDQLMALYNKNAAPAPAAQTTPTTSKPDVSKMSDDELLAAYNANKAKGPLTTTQDVIHEGAKGLGRGLASAAGDVGEAVAGPFGPSHHFANLMADLGLGERPAPEPGYGQRLTQAAGIEASPQTTAGRYAGAVGEFAGNPESYIGPGGVVGKVLTATGAGLGSEAAGDLGQKFAPDAPKTQAALKLIGAIAGGHGASTVPRIITPNIVSPERQAMVNTLDREGVHMSAGDRTGNTMLKATESELSPGANEAQQRQFQQAAFNRVGEQIGDRPILGRTGAVTTMMDRIGRQFDGLIARNSVNRDPQLVQDLNDVHNTFNSAPGLYPPDTVNSVNAAINRIHTLFNQAGGAPLSGADYQTLRSDLRRAAMGSENPQRAEGLHDVVNALDDAMGRTIARTNPRDIGAWPQARRDYQNALALEAWAGSANMTPATLAQATKAVFGKRQYVRGLDDMSELAEAGRTVLKQYQDSGTPRRQQVERALGAIGGVAGGALGFGGGHALGGSEGDIAGLLLGEAAAPFVTRPVARAALMNPVTQAYLSGRIPGQVPFRTETSPSMMALVNAIGGRGNSGPPLSDNERKQAAIGIRPAGGETPPAPGARKAKDGRWYVPDPNRPGKFLEARP